MLPHPVRSDTVKKAAVGDERNNPLIADSVGSPPEGFDVGVAQAVLKSCPRIRAVGLSYTLVNHWVFSVLVVVVFIRLPRVVRRVADDNEDRRFFLPPHAGGVGFGEQLELCSF